MIKLKTKLPAVVGRKPVGDYTAWLYKDDEGPNGACAVMLKIVPCKGTSGSWSYYLQPLLCLDDWSAGKPSDILCLDMGQRWEVSNMLALYKEIINEQISCL